MRGSEKKENWRKEGREREKGEREKTKRSVLGFSLVISD